MPLFKSRKRVFTGVRPWEMLSRSPGVEAEAPVERPVPLETASSKKLAISLRSPSFATRVLRSQAAPSTSSADEPSISSGMFEDPESEEDYRYVGNLQGYRLLDCEDLIQAASGLGCLSCGASVKLVEDLSVRRGLTSKLFYQCTNTVCKEDILLSNPYAGKSKSLNVRSVLAMRTIGRGHSGMESFCGMMDMLPPVASRIFGVHNQTLGNASEEIALQNMLDIYIPCMQPTLRALLMLPSAVTAHGPSVDLRLLMA